MLKIDKCVGIETTHSPVASNVSRLEEGVALVFVREAGKLVVQASTGAAGENFAGIAASRHYTPSTAVRSVVTTIPTASPYTVSLASTPVSTEAPGITIDGVVAAAGVPAAGEYLLSGSELTFEASDAGKEVTITYRYELTKTEADFLFGSDNIMPDMPGDYQMARYRTGVLWTDQFMTADDWSDDSLPIKLAADGKFTNDAAATGTEVIAIVEEIPSVTGGWLAIRLNP